MQRHAKLRFALRPDIGAGLFKLSWSGASGAPGQLPPTGTEPSSYGELVALACQLGYFCARACSAGANFAFV